jgi:hypothetical protein
MTVKIVDRGWNDMIRRMEKLKHMASKVGYPHSEETDENGTSVLYIASVHEFGCNIEITDKMRNYLHSIGIHVKNDTTHIHIPMRSHVRSAYDEDLKKLTRMAELELGLIVDGKSTAEQSIARLGEYHAGVIKKKITDGPFVKLHPATIERKRSSRPLVDKGQMRASVTHVEGVFA